jgi:hypothetical protein
MIPDSTGNAMMILWLVFRVALLLGLGAVIVWGLRRGQFRNTEHARRLPLDAEIPEDEETPGDAHHV